MPQSNQFYNHPLAREHRRTLRNTQTPTERTLWLHLRREQIAGAKFRRQFSVGHYVLDFYAPALKLAIEVDGECHNRPEAQEYDTIRQKTLEGLGIHFLRFTNQQVIHEIEAVLATIEGCATEAFTGLEL